MAKETILCIFSFRKKLTFIRSVFVDINPLRLFSENYAKRFLGVPSCLQTEEWI